MLGARGWVIAAAVVSHPDVLYLSFYLFWLTWSFHTGTAFHSFAFPDYALAVVVIVTVMFSSSIQGKARRLQQFEVSRGELWNGVRALVATANIMRPSGAWGVPAFRVYVVPDEFRPRMFAGSVSVFVWRRYLDAMSRAEIDALAARQLTRQNLRYHLLNLWPAVAGAFVAVGLFEFLNVSVRSRLMALPLLLAAEIAILVVLSPEILLRADLRAIRLTGNAEVFLSAVADAARLDGSAADMAHLGKLARKAGVPLDRLRELVERRDVAAGDRYPTTGDYLTTGLP